MILRSNRISPRQIERYLRREDPTVQWRASALSQKSSIFKGTIFIFNGRIFIFLLKNLSFVQGSE